MNNTEETIMGSDEELVQRLKSWVGGEPENRASPALEESHRDSIDKALDSRGDAFGRNDVITLSADGMTDIRMPVKSLPATLGTGKAADYAINGRGISAVHCRFERDGALVRLLDAGSKNGTFVNGKKTTAAHLREGDVIVIGLVRLMVRRL